MANTPEKKVKKMLDTLMAEQGVYFFAPQSGIYGRAGIPDRIYCVNGRFVGIEAKADRTKKPTDNQLRELASIRNNGGMTFIVYDETTIKAAVNWVISRKAAEKMGVA